MQDSLLTALFEMEERRPWSVSELSSELCNMLERSFASVWVEGEISGFKTAPSGHWYFSLTDGSATIRACCFKGSNYRIRFRPSDGLQVRVRGKIDLYEKKGDLQLIAESLEPVGEGALAVAFEQIKAKLAREGIFDQELKRPLPPHPRRVGVVTSAAGAVFHDIRKVLERRAGSVSILLAPTLVQGETAGEQIARAIELMNEYCDGCAESERVDVLIVARGGGSAEDLWPFNEEQVARAIRASRIPVISAVGHETDFTIADLAADLRAPTPSAAAELVARAEAEVAEQVNRSVDSLFRAMRNLMLEIRGEVQELALSPVFTQFPQKLKDLGHRSDGLISNAADAMNALLCARRDRLQDLMLRLSPVGLASKVGDNRKRLAVIQQRAHAAGAALTVGRVHKLDTAMASLDAMSPLRVLERGYSLTKSRDGRILRDSAGVAPNDQIVVRLARGELEAEVRGVRE